MARQLSKLTEEVGFLRAKQSAAAHPGENKENSILRSTLSTLESRFKEVKDLYTNQKRELEEFQFECETLKSSVDRLKNECQDSSDRETSERKQRHALEMNLIELKKKLSESTVAQKETEEAFKQSLNELNIMRGELTQQSEYIKSERRKCLGLDRELEQFKFLAERKDKEHRDNIDTLNIQIKNMRVENEMLTSRNETLAREVQLKQSKDGKDISSLMLRIRELESTENKMIISIDDLQKKVTFYKEKAVRKDYDSVNKNSILERVTSILRFVSAIRDEWETEKFIIRQEISCISSFITQLTDVYFHQIKPKQLRKLVEKNISSKIFSKYISDSDGITATGKFVSPSQLSSSKKENISYRSSMLTKKFEDDPTTVSCKITPKKQFPDLCVISKLSSPPQDRHRLHTGVLGRTPLRDIAYARSGLLEQTFSRGVDTFSNRLCSNFEVRMTGKEPTSEFISRINAKVLERTKAESGSYSGKTPIKNILVAKENNENYHNNIRGSTDFRLDNNNKDNQKLYSGEDKFDYQKIERESEEIAQRIQALKLRDFSQFK